MAEPPSGTVTFLFTDKEGSTKLWERDATAMRSALVRHDEILRSTLRSGTMGARSAFGWRFTRGRWTSAAATTSAPRSTGSPVCSLQDTAARPCSRWQPKSW